MDREGSGPNAQAPDGSADGAGPRGKESWPAWFVSGSRGVVRAIFKERKQVSRSRVVMLFLFAGVTAVLVAYELGQVFDVAVPWAILFGIVACIITFLANWTHVTRVDRQKGSRAQTVCG